MEKCEICTDNEGNIYALPLFVSKEEALEFFPNQPERSKREDSQLIIIKAVGDELRRGEDNIIEEMRCSEH